MFILGFKSTFAIMTIKKIDFSKTLTDEQVYDCLVKNYALLGNEWMIHQWNWMNYLYKPFKDHIKFLIIISLVEKTLQFYNTMNIDLNFDQFNSKPTLLIDKFSITEVCEKLSLPKETIRRKVLELEQLGILKRNKKQIILDRSAFDKNAQEIQIKITSKYITLFSKQLSKSSETKNIFLKNLTQDVIENIIRKNWSLCLRWFFKMQIPLILSYNKIFNDILSFHIMGTVLVNQTINLSKRNIYNINLNRKTWIKNLVLEGKNSPGLSAMSISDMTNIPRATVIRKCKTLIKKNILLINDKKQYLLGGPNIRLIEPHQALVLKDKSKFLRKVLNLIIIS
jgi:DNA-binding Lrp family transcriptional regulator